MWKIFQRWERVVDVFISRRLDPRNRRLGFVSFQGVMDAQVLERRLDAIWIGLWKLRVNLPKFSRKETRKPEMSGERKNEQARTTWRQVNPAQVVRDGDESASKKALDNSVVCFQVAVESTKWLEECFVGRLIELNNVMSIVHCSQMLIYNFFILILFVFIMRKLVFYL